MPPPLTFIVNVFNFLDRKDLEIVSNTGKYVNRIVRKHFPSKPCRFLKDVTLEIRRDEDGLRITLFSKKYVEYQSSGNEDPENESSGSQDLDNQSVESQDSKNQSSGTQDLENHSLGNPDAENQSIGSQDSENQSRGNQDAETQSSGSQDAETQFFESQDSENQSSGNQNAEIQSIGNQDAETQSSGSQDSENQSFRDLCFNPYKNEWVHKDKSFDLEVMRPFLSQFVRFGEAHLHCQKYPYTPEDVTILASISHVWSGRFLWLCVWSEDPMNFRDNVSNSLHNILTNDAIFSTRCLDLNVAAKFVSLHDYSRVYTVDVLLLTSYDDDEQLNIGTLLALIEHKPQFPESKTVFVVHISTFETRVAEVTDAICKSFSSASTPCSFQLLIIHDESYGENEEFCLENGTTREVLQLKNVGKDSSFVTRICEICNLLEFHEKFILVDRSRI